MGDQVLAINDVVLDTASVSEAMRQMQCDAGDQLVLEILPKVRSRAATRLTSAASSLSSNSSITCPYFFLIIIIIIIIRGTLCLRDITSAPSLLVFRRKLKTHLFRQSYPDIILQLVWLVAPGGP